MTDKVNTSPRDGEISRRTMLATSAAALVAATGGPILLQMGRAYAQSSSAVGAPAETLVVGFGSGPNGTDMDFYQAPRSIEIYRNVCISPLAYPPKPVGSAYEPDFTKLEGHAAKEWTVSPDGKSITITLKSGVMSSVGNELTVDDPIWTIRRNFALNGINAGFLKTVAGLSTPDNVVKKDRYTYTITLDRPNALIESNMAHVEFQILDSAEYKKHVTGDDPWAVKWAQTNIVGHGPYKLTAYQAGESFTLERNENYSAKLMAITGNIGKIVAQAIPNSSSRLQLLQAGSIDMGFDFSASELSQLEGSGVRVDRLSGNYLQWLGFTFAHELKDLNVRFAIMHALPLDQLVSGPYLGIAKQMDSMNAPSYPGYSITRTAWQKPKYDLNLAKSFLAKSAYPNGFDTTLDFDAGVVGQEETATIIKSALQGIGINVQLNKRQTTDYFQYAYAIGGGFPGLFLYRDFAGNPDPLFSIGLWVITGHCCSPGKYGNADIDRLYREAQTTIGDPQKRFDLARQIEDIMWNKDPFGVPLDFNGFQAASSPKVTGWMWGPVQEVYWHSVVKK